MDIFSEGVDQTRDLKKERTVSFGDRDGNDFKVKQYDPYGFWKIHRVKGNVPEALSGDYTTAEHAQQAIELHLKSQPIPKKIEKVSQ